MRSETSSQTELWYQSYYAKNGKDRNDILSNTGVLFQYLANKKSVVEAFREIPLSKSECKILDVGCGRGDSLAPLMSFGFDPGVLYGIDVIPERVAEGARRFPATHLSCGDATHMAYESNFFDVVMESTMFVQITDEGLAQKMADEMLRVLKPSGYLVLIDWRYGFGHPEYRAVSKRRIDRLFHAGLKTERWCQTSGALIPPLGRFLSTYFSSLYFVVAKWAPPLVGQVTTVLKKKDDQ